MIRNEEIIEVKCDGCGCAIVPELHNAVSGEFEMQFFICPFCHKNYVISVTDAELRERIGECHALKEANDRGQLSSDEKQRMVELLVLNVQRSKELREIYAPKEATDE